MPRPSVPLSRIIHDYSDRQVTVARARTELAHIRPADWHILLFATRSADGKPTVIPLNLQRRAKQINERSARSETESAK